MNFVCCRLAKYLNSYIFNIGSDNSHSVILEQVNDGDGVGNVPAAAVI